MFTGTIKLANIDDYIVPSQQCVKPLMEKAKGPLKAQQSGEQTAIKATVTLNDCLACSGCVTTAQTILIEQMSVSQFREYAAKKTTVVFISPHSIASLANRYQTSQHTIMQSLRQFFKKHYSVDAVLDMHNAIEQCHAQIVREWESKDSNEWPVLCSECPGWVCYAQKVAPKEVVEHMSRVKSPQQIMGSLIRQKYNNNELYVVGIMPCYDKKLQSIRFEFEKNIKEVDLVLSTLQIVDLINITQKGPGCSCGKSGTQCECSKKVVQTELNRFPYKSQIAPVISSAVQGGQVNQVSALPRVKDPKCNGYIITLLDNLGIKQFTTKQIRNQDFVQFEFTYKNKTIKMAQCYGFRNIQNIVKKIKNKQCQYAYIQIMACPSGCFNGGGQIKIPAIKPKDLAKKLQQNTLTECQYQNSEVVYHPEQRYRAEYKSIQKSTASSLLNW